MKLYAYDARFTPSIDSRLGTFHFDTDLMEKAKDGMCRNLVFARDRKVDGSLFGTAASPLMNVMPSCGRRTTFGVK